MVLGDINILISQHANIVKYKGFVKEREFLYIILEYVFISFPAANFLDVVEGSARMVLFTIFANALANSRKILLLFISPRF
jgi:hypothetical protein